MLYCKLMSPARILEWIMVDGLKQKFYWVPRDGEGKIQEEFEGEVQEEFENIVFLQ